MIFSYSGKTYPVSIGMIMVSLILTIYVYYCIRRKVWPDLERIIELIAYGSGFFLSFRLLGHVFFSPETHDQLTNFAGAFLFGYVSLKGVIRQFKADVYEAKNSPD